MWVWVLLWVCGGWGGGRRVLCGGSGVEGWVEGEWGDGERGGGVGGCGSNRW